MYEFLFFMIGLLLGGVVAVTKMCLLQTSRTHHSQTARKEDDEF